MKRVCWILALLLAVAIAAGADAPAYDLGELAGVELQELGQDIEAERRLHHMVAEKGQPRLLAAVKQEAERYYRAQGLSISWAWYGREYRYGRKWNFFTLNTHLDYKDKQNKDQQRKVYAELFDDGRELRLLYLKSGEETLVDQRDSLPERLLPEGSTHTINARTGIDLSLLDEGQLHALEQAIQQEIDRNHRPKGHMEGRVSQLVKGKVEGLFKPQNISVSWPWFDYAYTNDWGCYTLTTRISYKDARGQQQKRSVYAELYEEQGSYDVYYLKLGEELVFDKRDGLKAPASLHFLASRDYLAARDLAASGDEQGAITIWRRLGSFADSAAQAEAAQGRLNELAYAEAEILMEQGAFDRALEAFQALQGYRDSAQQAEAARGQILLQAYQAARQQMDAQRYEQALAGFEALGGYEDSTEQAAACRLAIQQRDYAAAEQLKQGGQLEQALQAYQALRGYQDSAEQALAMQGLIQARDYEQALRLVQDFQYERAIAAFAALEGYRDSQSQMAASQAALASIDRTLSVPESAIALYPKGSYTLKPVASALSAQAPAKTSFVFSSSDEQVARVDKQGKVIGVQAGETFITYAAQDNPHVAGRLSVRVLVPATKLTLSESKLALQLSALDKALALGNLQSSLTPENAQAQSLAWHSSNEKVATVDQEGRVRAHGVGQARITLTAQASAGAPLKASSTVTVSQAVESVHIEPPEGIYVGRTVALKSSVLPKQAGNKKLSWQSSDPAVATVTADGKVRGIAPGPVRITATAASGVQARLDAVVETPPTLLKVSGAARLIARNHVGSRWTKEFQVNDTAFSGSTRIGVRLGDQVKLYCWITEHDSDPDVGMLSETVNITEDILKNGLTIEQTVYVHENRGRYSGYSAEWEVTLRLIP